LSVIVRNRSDRTVDQTGCPDPGPTVWTGRALPGTRASLAASHTNTLTHRRDASTGSKSPHRPQRRAMAHSFRQSLCDRLTRSVCLFLVAPLHPPGGESRESYIRVPRIRDSLDSWASFFCACLASTGLRPVQAKTINHCDDTSSYQSAAARLLSSSSDRSGLVERQRAITACL
jgi:hypothetical protein